MKHLQQQVRLIAQFGLDGGVPWLSNTDGALYFICKLETKDVNHVAVNCPNFKEEFESLWSNLKNEIISSNSLDGFAIVGFISNLAPQGRLQLLLGDLPLPFNNLTNALITSFVSSTLEKNCKTGRDLEILRELDSHG